VLKSLLPPLAAGVVVAGVSVFFGVTGPLQLATFGACGFAGVVTIREGFGPILQRVRRAQDAAPAAALRAISANRRRVGGYVVHAAVIIVVAAITVSQSYKQTAEASLQPGQSVKVGDYLLTLNRVQGTQEPHRFSVAGVVDVSKSGRALGQLAPKMNFYPTQREPVGAPHVRTIRGVDLYLSLMSFEEDGSGAVIKVFINPGVAWIWWSLPLFVIGSLISLWPHRRAKPVEAPSGATVSAS
jgi:cytochrome c-type biogenesis protein CcmF